MTQRRRSAAFELAAVQGVQLSLQLLIVQFDLFGVPPLLRNSLVKFLQLIFVMAFSCQPTS